MWYIVCEIVKIILLAVLLYWSWRRRTPEPDPLPRLTYIYDYDFCVGKDELNQTMREINQRGFELLSVTQTAGAYTIFFRRITYG